ncbi:DUF3107 domain-containing protein [Corynebacterium alimapuense]|uniref:DUF3107 domain-containing protein n=1 Tax=Corynebacterium alimapuense TaxID=1576874 RepID=A0A3M8K7C6_9CORY|nr:DUF3107 domain-containing protein [Corynebacterium alimapuense]RNE49040.1 DUF3107 domain-containing protein [Corynebacterium alimapuense]
MDIKIGFADSPRELVITLDSDQESVVAQITDALNNDSDTLQLQDTKGRLYIVRSSRISYVEVGTVAQRSVGFAGA